MNEILKSNLALHEAKFEYLRNAAPNASHPYYWSSFVLVEDVNNDLIWLSHQKSWITILFILLILGAILYGLIRKLYRVKH